MNKLVATSLEGKFHVFDMRTQHPTKGFASVTEKVSERLSVESEPLGVLCLSCACGVSGAFVQVTFAKVASFILLDYNNYFA